MSRRIGLVVNPSSGKGRGQGVGDRVAEGLRRLGDTVIDLSGRSLPHASARAGEALEQGLDLLVVVGGDGMAHLAAQVCAGSATPVAIVGAGSGNDVARSLHLPVHDPAASLAMIATGTARTIDLGRHTGGDGGERWFVGVLCAGFDAVVNERANGWSWPRGTMRYNLAIARELPVFRPIDYTLHIDGTRIDTEAMLVAVANGTSYGGGMKVCPDASMDDGMLDVFIVRAISIPTLARLLPKVFKGTHVEHPAVQIIRGRHITLEADGIITYADGERFTKLPATIEAAPGALRVLVPEADVA